VNMINKLCIKEGYIPYMAITYKKRKEDECITIGSNEVRKNIIFQFLSYKPTLKKHGGHHIYM
jgi:hypothetical protein